MFKYYIESIQTQNQPAEVHNHKSQTLLLASSRSHPQHTHNYQHFHMLRQDYEGLFYRKLNSIIQLESIQQVLQQNEGMLSQLSSSFLQQIAVKKETTSLQSSEYRRQGQCGIVLMAREMVLLHSKVRKQWSLLRKKAELQHEINKLTIDKKSLVEEIKIFASKLTEISLQNFKEHHCIDLQKTLLQQARKYNLTKVISNFMGELREIIVGRCVSQTISNLLKSSSQDLKSTIKMDQLRLFALPQKNRKELINNLTLYLKQFYSSNVYKDFTQSIMRLTKEYELCKEKTTFLSKKLAEEIQTNVKLLKRVFKQISTKSGVVMDYKIDIEILGEETKLLQKNIWVAQQSMNEYIHKQTEMLLREYFIQEGRLFKQQASSQKMSEMADYKYFYEQLSSKYKDFLVQHLRKAEQIQKLKEKIQQYNLILASYQKQLKMHQSPEHSQIETHRSFNQKNISIRAEDSINQLQHPQRSLEETIQQEANSNNENTQLAFNPQSRSHQNEQSIESKQNKQRKYSKESKQSQEGEDLYLPLGQANANLLSPYKANNYKGQGCLEIGQSCGEMALKMTALLKQCQRRQKFIVNKVVNIGGKSGQTAQKKSKNSNREYEAKLTRKYLILQPMNEQTLSICEKIELSQIKKYIPNYHTATLILEYASCRVLLGFLTFNMDIFVKKIERVFHNARN